MSICPVQSECCEKYILNPHNGRMYCINHVQKCDKAYCGHLMFNYEENKYFTERELNGIPDLSFTICRKCYKLFCDEHTVPCNLCGSISEICRFCSEEITKGKFNSVCFICFRSYQRESSTPKPVKK